MGPSHSLLAQPMSWEIDVAVENLKRKKNSFFTSLHLDWHLTETCSPIPFISSLKEMINTAGQCSSISLDRSTGVFIKPILMS